MSITTITRSLNDLTLFHAMKGVTHDHVATFPVAVDGANSLAEVDPYFAGVRFHALLRRIADHDALTPPEKAMLPWLNRLRTELRGLGVTYLTPGVRYPSTRALPSGEPDLVVTGGLAARGIVEVKVTAAVPERAASEHLLQLGGYAAHLAHAPHRTARSVWAAVAYVPFRQAEIRLFAYRDATTLIRRAHRLFTAHAA